MFRGGLLPLSGSRPDRMAEVPGIAAFLKAFFYDVIDFLYVRNLGTAKKNKDKQNGNKKEKF